MKRRSLLKSIGALGIAPLMPSLPASALASPIPAVSAGVSSHTYKWAEMIVRAHNKCSPGMLERLLKVDAATASALKAQLLEKGVISAHANAFGIHTASKPLYEGAFMRPSSQIKQGLQKASELIDEMMEEDEEHPETVAKKEPEISDLPIEDESACEQQSDKTHSVSS